MDADGGEDVPGGHLADVVVAADAVGAEAVGAVADARAGPELGAPGLAGVDEEEGDVVAGFVGVVVVIVPEEIFGVFSKKAWRASQNFSSPPMRAIRPGTSLGTNQPCW